MSSPSSDIVRRIMRAGIPESVARLIALRLHRRPSIEIEIVSDQAIDAITRPQLVCA